MIQTDIDADGIATLTWDIPDKSVNVMNDETVSAFKVAVEAAIADEAVKGVVIASAKDGFIAGADLESIATLSEPAEIMAAFAEIDSLYRAMETCGKPFAAAINGNALGGGFELTLACHHRVAADRDDSRVGLPEVGLGLLPGAGGTQRLPRMIGVRVALPLMLEGTRLHPKKALDIGIIDALVPPGDEIAAAKRWVLDNPGAAQPWDRRGYEIPGGGIQSRPGYETMVAGNAMLHEKTLGNYPAAQAIMSCVYEGLQVPIEVGLRIESRYFTQLLRSDTARNMIRMFFSLKRARKLEARPKDVVPTRFEKIGVLGAGLMGAGIAHVSALAGLEVAILDFDGDLAAAGKARIGDLLVWRVKCGSFDAAGRDAVLDRIHPTADFGDLTDCALVIEAVVEVRAVKADVTAKTEAVIADNAVFASNTSTLPITGLAEASARPANFIGLHFFSPVERMPLVEVIRGAATDDACLAKALDFVKRIGKTPIVVNDSRGFFTSRVFATYLQEGLAMLREGVTPALIENAGCMAGMPLGPLALADEVSIGLVHHIMKQTQADMGEDYAAAPGDAVVTAMVESHGRSGKKAGKGFYDYPEDGERRLWPDLSRHFPLAVTQPDIDAVKRRLLHIQGVETARCLEQNVVTDPRDADVGSILGWGFAPFTGGVASYIDGIGVTQFVAQCDALAETHGPRFAPPDLLRDMAARDARFHLA